MNSGERHTMLRTINQPKKVKHHNQKLILSMLRQNETLYIADISKNAKLSKTTIAKMINEFEEKELIIAAGKGTSSDMGGKKPERFTLNPHYSHVVAMAILNDRIIGALADLKCNLLHQRNVECDIDVGYEQAVEKMAQMVLALMEDAKLESNSLCRIIIGCEGVVDAAKNAVHYTVYHLWGRNLPICEDLAKRLPFPCEIRVNNNVRLAGYAQLILNPGQYGTIVVISSSYSAGGCIIESRQLIHGPNGFVGEFGHMILDPHSKVKCSCGSCGCFGALASPNEMMAAAHEKHADYPQSVIQAKARDNSLSIEDVFKASNAGDPFACMLIDRVVPYFAMLIHNIVILRDPVKVIIQGTYSAAGNYFIKTLRQKVASFPFYKMERNLPIEYSTITAFNPFLVGAAYFAVDEFLNSNEIYD